MTTDASTIPSAGVAQAPPWSAQTRTVVAIAALTAGLMALLVALLITPGRSLIGIYINDLMVFYDGAHRLLAGEIPNQDFHTPLGPLAYVLPALGLRLGGSLGSMLPIATGLFAVLLAPPLIYAAASRLPFWFAGLFVLYVALLAIAPVNPGDSPLKPTFAMFYNRFCWSGLSVLLVLALPQIRLRARADALDALCIAWLLALLFYLKLSYALVGLAFTLALVALPAQRRAALFALPVTAAILLIVQLTWGRTGAYLADASVAAKVSGAVRGGAYHLALLIIGNLRQECAYAAALALGLARKTKPLYLLASIVMAVAGVMLLNQNAQETEIPTLLPGALLAVLGPNSAPPTDARRPAISLAALLLTATIALPAIGNEAFGLRYFRHELRHPARVASAGGELDGVVTHEGTLMPDDPTKPLLGASPNALAEAFRRGVGDTATLNLLRQFKTAQPISQTEYLDTLHDGAAALRADPRLAGPVYTFDLQNPFNAMLDRSPPRGDWSWNHYGRTFNEHIFPAPQQALADVRVIMDPKDPMEAYSTHYQELVYADYMDKNFRLTANTTYWRIYRRVPAKAAQ